MEQRYSLKVYINYPPLEKNGTGFILDALRTQFRDVTWAQADDGTFVIDCDGEIQSP